MIKHNHLVYDNYVQKELNRYWYLRCFSSNKTKQRICKRLDRFIKIGLKNMELDANVIIENVPKMAKLYQSGEEVCVTVEHLIDTIHEFTGIMPVFALQMDSTTYLFKIHSNPNTVVKQFDKFILSGNILKSRIILKQDHIIERCFIFLGFICLLYFLFYVALNFH